MYLYKITSKMANYRSNKNNVYHIIRWMISFKFKEPQRVLHNFFLYRSFVSSLHSHNRKSEPLCFHLHYYSTMLTTGICQFNNCTNTCSPPGVQGQVFFSVQCGTIELQSRLCLQHVLVNTNIYRIIFLLFHPPKNKVQFPHKVSHLLHLFP